MQQPGGIRSKITIWFYLVLLFMIISSVLLFWIVGTVEEKHFNIEKADVFLEDILEVRRRKTIYCIRIAIPWRSGTPILPWLLEN